MKKSIAIILTVTGLALVPMTSQAEEEALFSSQSLTPETALKAATAALQKCRADGYQVAVAVTDRSGLVQALLRDRFAGAHTIDTATRKAWTSASFRTDTVEIVAFLKDNPQQVGIYQIGGAMMVGGGKVIDLVSDMMDSGAIFFKELRHRRIVGGRLEQLDTTLADGEKGHLDFLLRHYFGSLELHTEDIPVERRGFFDAGNGDTYVTDLLGHDNKYLSSGFD